MQIVLSLSCVVNHVMEIYDFNKLSDVEVCMKTSCVMGYCHVKGVKLNGVFVLRPDVKFHLLSPTFMYN